MYNIIIYIYQFGVMLYSLFNEKVRKMWRGERDAIRVLREKVNPNEQYVWFHAASLGEFEQGRPLRNSRLKRRLTRLSLRKLQRRRLLKLPLM